MSEPSQNGNGCYVLIGTEKFAIKRNLAEALRALLTKQEIQNGTITMHIKSGGVSACELKTIFVE